MSYVTNRKQIVKLKNFSSDPFNILSGVSQGSHLAPLLFILFINDLYFLNSRKFQFSDDYSTIYFCIKHHRSVPKPKKWDDSFRTSGPIAKLF